MSVNPVVNKIKKKHREIVENYIVKANCKCNPRYNLINKKIIKNKPSNKTIVEEFQSRYKSLLKLKKSRFLPVRFPAMFIKLLMIILPRENSISSFMQKM